jgi:hypothetical protein
MSQDNQILSNETPKASRRAILTAAPAAVAGALLAAGTVANAAVLGIARTDEVDPISAVIAEHRAASEGVVAAFAREDRETDDDEITDAAKDRVGDAEHDLFTTAPATLAGVAALLDHLAGDEIAFRPELTVLEYAYEGGGDTVREFPSFLAAALRDIIARGKHECDHHPV